MKSYLLDTHILLWSLLEPERLCSRVVSVLENPDNDLWLSPITTWEIIVLAEKGRIELNQDPVPWLESVYSTLPFYEAPLNHAVAMQSRCLDLVHQDPADRFIAASAIVYELVLITSDVKLINAAGSYTVLAN